MARSELKFPKLSGVDYMDLIKNKKNVLQLKGLDVEGFSWRQLQEYIGSRIPPDRYSYVLKFKKSNEIHKGTIKAIGDLSPVKPKEDDAGVSVLQASVAKLSQKVDSLKGEGGIGIETLIEVTKASYTQQISFLNLQLTSKDGECTRLLDKISKLEDELGDQDGLIEDLKSKTGLSQYIEIAKEVLSFKAGNIKPLESLADSNSSDIPPELIEILGVVNWNAVESGVVDKINETLKIIIQKLPLKGA